MPRFLIRNRICKPACRISRSGNALSWSACAEFCSRQSFMRVCPLTAGKPSAPSTSKQSAYGVARHCPHLSTWRRRSRPEAHGDSAEGWLYRTAVRTGLNELRREMRRSRYESLFGFFGASRKLPTPEDLRAAKEEREKVWLTTPI